MHEYEILSPPLPGTVLTRIKAPNSVKKHHVPDPEQPGPSHEYDAGAVTGNGEEGFGGAQDGALYGGGMVKNAGYYGNPLQNYLPLVEYDNKNCVSIQDQSGASYHYEAAAMNGDGFTGAQAHDSCGGGMVDTSGAYYDPSGYVPECGGEYSNYYGEYQKWRYQQDTSNQYQAGDDNVKCAGGEQQARAFCGNSDNGSVLGTETSAHSTISLCGEYQQWQYQQDPSSQYQAGDDAVIPTGGGEQQAGALCGNSDDNGSVVVTETCAQSTISLCGDGEEECDVASFYKLFFVDNDDGLKSEQNGAGDPANELVI
uniref:Uncharacterized protein n=1 Tax=Avena sativa TaxID=4498 RepID=A0ACD5X546_AVESA